MSEGEARLKRRPKRLADGRTAARLLLASSSYTIATPAALPSRLGRRPAPRGQEHAGTLRTLPSPYLALPPTRHM